MAMAKLFITGLSTVITCSSAVVFKGAAMAVVLLLMLVQLPGYLSCLLLCAIRAAVERAVAATFAAAGDAVSAAADAAMGWRDAASSNSTAAVAFVQAAMGRPKALLAEMLAIFGLVASLSCSPATRRRRTSLLGLPRAPPRPAATFFSGAKTCTGQVTARITDKNCSSKQTATEHAGSEPIMRVSTVCSMKTELHQKNQALQASRKLAEGKEPRP
ncbi:Os09g0552200 [Oryza sativa Japonica Group]|uniref:Os09g0552200 protein n=1 Tax=Oryza sativa subsp. japonica TaxID=39947 RepID=Q0IZS9_ORYSJ|nr:Os09g0552200 [Oryza sativa Japonica Group]|eukprot:NP_001063872.1 Os09g0552200 [Oryza sativa Japonica Group]